MGGKRECSPRISETRSSGPQGNVHGVFLYVRSSVPNLYLKGANNYWQLLPTIVHPEIPKHYFKRRPATRLKGIKLLHDNARPHKSKEVKETIASMGLEELEHPPYSPNLAPCDFWLFDGLKRHLAGLVFEEDVQIERAIRLYLRDIPQEEYKKTFFKWIERLKLVIEQKGDYFENLMQFLMFRFPNNKNN